MAAIGDQDLTLLDRVKRVDPDGNLAKIVELQTKRNPILQDAVAMEGNLETGHRFTTRATLPALGWRRFNQGVTPSKSTTEQVDETCGMLSGFSQVDRDLASLGGQAASTRASEDDAFMQAMANEVATALIYSSVKVNPEKFHGLAPRFDLLAAYDGLRVLNFTGSPSGNDQTSVWFVTWGEPYCSLIYPKGMLAGLKSEDLGVQLVRDSSGRIYSAWVTEWMWKLGLVVKDFRQVVRICNIDTSGGLDVTKTDLIEKMIDAYYNLYDPEGGRTVVYCNPRIGAHLHKQALNRANNALALADFAGRPITTFLGKPVRVIDAITSTESVVV